MPQNVFWAFFLLAAVFVIGGSIFFLLRGERVGTLKLPGRIGLDLALVSTAGPATNVRLTVAREGGASPTVQMRVVAPMAMYMERLDPDSAVTLAQLLETASSRLRAP